MWGKALTISSTVALLAAMFLTLLFLGLHFSWLEHPYFWDEAWSYGRAVHHLAHQGTSWSPAALDPQLFRGHPPVFYNAAAAFLRWFGANPTSAHVFALLEALLLAFVWWQFTARRIGYWAALGVLVMLLASQPFYALATRLYPELMLCLWICLAAWGWLEGKPLVLALGTALALLTKESGLCWPVAVLASHVLGLWTPCPRLDRRTGFALLFGVGLAFGWYAWQYAMRGWWLFPEHMDAISTGWGAILESFWKKIHSLLIKDGRFLLFVPILVGAVWAARYPNRLSVPKWLRDYTTIGLLFVLAYVSFSAFNFESSRYGVVANVVLIGLATWWLCWWAMGPVSSASGTTTAQSRSSRKWAAVGILSAYVLFQSYALYAPPTDKETSTGYLETLHLWRETVRRCNDMGLRKGPIAASYLLSYALSDPDLGYLGQSKPFETTQDTRLATYLLFDHVESPDRMARDLAQFPGAVLVWEGKRGRAWVRVYKK